MPWLIVAAETREIAGIRKQAGGRWLLAANGPGALAGQALRDKTNVEGIVSTGFCGALDPTLRIGDIVVSSAEVSSPRPFLRGEIVSVDRVAVTSAEKRALRERTGAAAVEMEAAGVAARAADIDLQLGLQYRLVSRERGLSVERRRI